MDNFVSKNEINFRGKLNSDDHNQKIIDFNENINSLETDMELMESLVDETKEISDVNDRYIKNSLNVLKSKFETLLKQKEELETNGVYKTLYVYTDNFHNAHSNHETISYINKESNSAIIDFNKKDNKLLVHDDIYNQTFIPKSTSITVDFEVDEDYEVVKQNDLKNIIAPEQTFYSKIKTSKNVSEVIMNITFVLPKDIINNNDLNTIIMEAFPYNSVDILSIEYNNLGERKELNVLKNHPKSKTENLNDHVIEKSKKEMFNFEEVQTNEVYIKLRQKHFEDVLDDRFFYIGIEDLELVNLNYESQTSTLYSIVEFNSPGEKTIHSIDPVLNNPTQANIDDVKIDISYLDSLNNPIPIKENYPLKINNNKFLIKCTLYKKMTTPNISRFDIKYSN